jgi:hypothetical protein
VNVGGRKFWEEDPMKLIVGAAFALGVVLGGGQTLATNLVSDEVRSVDGTAPVADDTTETPETPETTEPTDPDGSTDGSTDESTDESTGDTETTEDGDAPAEVNYGQLVRAWLVCQGGEDTTICGTRPHPPGVATGFDAAHSKDHSAKGKSTHVKVEHDTLDHTAKHGDHAGHGHGKRA